ncbi:hypothetical protein EPYR_03701 [Erwinia pyrifoliae DSM 12163]|nr:hypothetical protein EPYR_03701 [Erwinia pyrifoliae DSM 12163]
MRKAMSKKKRRIVSFFRADSPDGIRPGAYRAGGTPRQEGIIR